MESRQSALGSWVSSIDRSARAAADTGGGLVSSGALIEGSNEKAQELAKEYRAALAAVVSQDPSAFGLRDRLLTSGSQLVDTLETIRVGTADWFPVEAGSPEDRQAAFVRAFAQHVAGSGGLVADAAIRKAAVACAQELLNGSAQLQQAIRSGERIPRAGFPGELFCLIFQLFFKKSLAGFIATIVAGKVKLAFPLLHVIDPAGRIADWAGQQVAALIPDPCEEGARLAEAPSLGDLARGLVEESADRVLGLPVGAPGSAAA